MTIFRKRNEEEPSLSDGMKFFIFLATVILMSVLFWKVSTYVEEKDMERQYSEIQMEVSK